MTTTVDFDALQAARGPRVTLLLNQDVDRSGVGGDFADFSPFESVYLEASAIRRVDPEAAGTLTLTVQHSDDGESWVTAHEFDFVQDGRLAFLVASPKAHWRASWTVGGHSEWRVQQVVATPTTIDASGGGGGGSQPGVARVLGPFTVTAADVDPDLGGAVIHTFSDDLLLLDAWLFVTETFDVATSLGVSGVAADLSYFGSVLSGAPASTPAQPNQLYTSDGSQAGSLLGTKVTSGDIALLSPSGDGGDTTGSVDCYLLVSAPSLT